MGTTKCVRNVTEYLVGMPSFWDYFTGGGDSGNSSYQTHHNLQEGLLTIASQTCNILVQVNNTNNISFGPNEPSTSSTSSSSSSVLLPPIITTTTTTKTTFKNNNRRLSRGESARKLFSDYKHRLSVRKF